MFSTCFELTPRAPIPDGRMERFMHPCFALWHIVAYCYALWNIVAHSGISWLTVDYCGIRWNIVVHWGILWRTLEYCGTLLLWHIVRTRSCKVSLVCFCGDVVLLKRIHLPSEGIATLLTKCNTMVFFCVLSIVVFSRIFSLNFLPLPPSAKVARATLEPLLPLPSEYWDDLGERGALFLHNHLHLLDLWPIYIFTNVAVNKRRNNLSFLEEDVHYSQYVVSFDTFHLFLAH